MNMLSKVDPWNAVAEGYAGAAGELFRAHSRKVLSHAQVTPEMDVADIACGPGTLTTQLADLGAKVTAVDFSRQMLAILKRHLHQNAICNVAVRKADGQDLPLPENAFDASFSLFGLMFYPDRAKGYAEMFRTLRPGGRVYVSSWSKMSDSPLFLVMAEALRRLDLARSAPAYDITSLENPEVLASEMIAAGFGDVKVNKLEHVSIFISAEELWESLVAGSAPITVFKSRMPSEVWSAKSEEALNFSRAHAGPFPARLGTVAWLGSGRKPNAASFQSQPDDYLPS